MSGEQMALQEVNGLSREEFVERFGQLYEHSPWVAERAWEERPFRTFGDLEVAFPKAMYGASREEQLEIIRSHPELAVKSAGELTPDSAREQRSAGLDGLSPEEYERFAAMNRRYREKFGIPFVVCVREHTPASILANAAGRLEHTKEEEIETALGEISKIATLRLRDLLLEGDG